MAEQSLIVKEKILSFIAKLIEKFDSQLIEKVYNPKKFVEFLLDEIKLKKLAGTTKGGIWHIIGVLISKYSIMLDSYKIEIHDVIFHEFRKLLGKNTKFEFKSVQGILKAYIFLLEDPQLSPEQSKIIINH